MPFAPMVSPSIGLTLLKGVLHKHNIESEILYFSLNFAKEVGVSIYSKISVGLPSSHDMLGEWLFSHVLFGDTKSDDEFIGEILLGNNPEHNKAKYGNVKIPRQFIKQALNVKKKVSEFIDDCAEKVLCKNPSIVGFTSVFQQQLASLSLAKKIKERNNDIAICFGGANNEGIMGKEVIKKFPFVDYVVSGEGEDAFPWLVSRVIEGIPVTEYNGIISQKNSGSNNLLGQQYAKPFTVMDELPFVKYDDYFEQLRDLKLDKEFSPRLLFETSRGCWWGVKNHCTFCGLNGESMKQRTKSANRALEEFKFLLDTYPDYEISVVDNILDYNYFKDFIPSLIELRKSKKYDLFYETKANLTKEQLRMLKDSGITTIQPGIESFCKETLKIMRKGVSPIQNLQLLKWCRELGIKAEWNILHGFPNENMEEYNEVAELIPLISHFSPPNGSGPIRLDRFSPNFDQADSLGFKEIKPYPTYSYIYPFSDDSLFNLAYFFTYDYKNYSLDHEKISRFSAKIERWRRVHVESALFYSENETHLLVWDLRPIAKNAIYVLSDLSKDIYLLCDKAIRLNQCVQKIKEMAGNELISDEEIIAKLEFFIKNKLMLFLDDHYLSLAISDKVISNTKKVADKINKLITTAEDPGSTEVSLCEPVFA